MKPKCDNTKCFACIGGECVVLRANDFKNKPCPFFKQDINDKPIAAKPLWRRVRKVGK